MRNQDPGSWRNAAVEIRPDEPDAMYHTGKPDGIPKEAAEKFASLINMSPCGDYGLTPVIPKLLAKYKAALHTKTERSKSYSKNMRPRKRKRT